MKIIINSLIATLMPVFLFCQARIVFNGANISINNDAKLVVQNPAPNALTVMSAGGIVSESAGNSVLWNIGANSASYLVPFISGGNSIPLSFTTSGTAGNGMFELSTYAGSNWQNSNYLPPTITNVNRDGTDNSNHVIDRFWQINASGYSTNPSLSNLVFTYNENEWNEAGNIIAEANLAAQSWNNTSDAWVTPGLGTDNPSTNQVTVSTVSGASLNNWWTLVDDEFALPLTLLSFTAEKQNENALLQWVVTAQINVSFYEIQRSINAIDFLPVGKVGAINNSNLNTDYSYTDALDNINATAVYYRLRMVDIDGKFTYSPIRFISLSDDNKSIQLFPNPATNLVVMKFGAVVQGSYRLSLLDAAGKQIMAKEINVAPNSIFYFHRSAGMAAGTYFMNITGNNVKQTFAVVFQ